MKKIFALAFIMSIFVNGALSQGCNYPTILCESAITYPTSRDCDNGYTSTLSMWYRIDVNSSAIFTSSWTTTVGHMTLFKAYGPFMGFDDGSISASICSSITSYSPYYTAGGSSVTNINFSSPLSTTSQNVPDGVYLIYIEYDICTPTVSIDLSGVTCTPSTSSVLPSLPITYTIAPSDPPPSDPPCDTCVTFQPIVGNLYWLSAWVKEDHTSQVKTYTDSYVELGFLATSGSTSLAFHTTGEIIDGWQRIVAKFTIPSGTESLKIDLVNDSGVDAYFDDVRIHPFNGSMKSYVYDPETLWLRAELDDNNYATIYEYDKEGGLVRIKKETSRGVVTIQETRSNTQKQN